MLAAVLDNVVYIDGGQFSWSGGGTIDYSYCEPNQHFIEPAWLITCLGLLLLTKVSHHSVVHRPLGGLDQ